MHRKIKFKKWMFRFLVTAIFIFSLLLIIVLNPSLTYAHKTKYEQYNVYHNKELSKSFLIRLTEATQLLQKSEFYNQQLQVDICLNEGSYYPAFIKTVTSPAFARGFYNKVVLYGNADAEKNIVELNGYQWNLTQLLAHELVHCIQFKHLGFFHSNPVANIPEWKWEGYAEYVSRQNANQNTLKENISLLLYTDESAWSVTLNDGTITPKNYFTFWVLVQYCMDVKQLSFQQILGDEIKQQNIYNEMMKWYNKP